jgi:hypothetical protein
VHHDQGAGALQLSNLCPKYGTVGLHCRIYCCCCCTAVMARMSPQLPGWLRTVTVEDTLAVLCCCNRAATPQCVSPATVSGL